MNLAICSKCGELKPDPLGVCPVCAWMPVEAGDIGLALVLSTQAGTRGNLAALRERIRTGRELRPPRHVREKLEALAVGEGYVALQAARSQFLDLPAGRITREFIRPMLLAGEELAVERDELSVLCQAAFGLGYAFHLFRKEVRRTCGTFWSLFRNLFRRIDYAAMARRSEQLVGKAAVLCTEVAEKMDVASGRDEALCFLLAGHVAALHELGVVLVQKHRHMAALAAGARGGAARDREAQILAAEKCALKTVDQTGRLLTEQFAEMVDGGELVM